MKNKEQNIKTLQLIGKNNSMVITINAESYEDAYNEVMETLQSGDYRCEEVIL